MNIRTLAGSIAICLTVSSGFAQISSYSEDFEGLDITSPTALADAGWLVFGNVFDAGGNYLYGYGPFGAPNGGPAFSAIATNEGGPDQGQQQLVTYSDYNNADHGNGFLIETNVFQEQVVDAGDVGKTFTFQFDAKLGDIQPPSTTLAFIKVIDSVTFALDGFVSVDTTNLPVTWGTYSMSITIDAAHVGDFFQIGFMTNATNYNPSGIVYDNVILAEDAACGAVYCETNPDNVADLAIDTCDTTAGSINLLLTGASANQFGYPMIGAGNGVSTDPPGAQGDLCLIGGAIGRYVKDASFTDGSGNNSWDIWNSVSGGGGGGIPNPPGGVIMAGQTWNFQAWHRDGMNPSKFSKALTVTFN